MTRLQKKCLVFSAGLHGLLLLTLVATAAFRSKPDDTTAPILTMIPANILDRAGVGGAEPVAAQQPQPQVQPAPQPQPAPAPPETQTAPVEPLPAPHVRETVVAPRPAPTPVRPRQVENIARSEKPAPSTPKPTSHQVVPDFTHATSSSATPAPPSRSTSDSQLAIAAATQRRNSAAAAALSDLANSVRTTGAKPTVIDLPGQGGGEAFVNYGTAVENIYFRAWKISDAASERLVVTTRIVVARDGSVISHEITSKSGDASFDRSVARALDDVQQLPPFPAGASDLQRTFSIEFKPLPK